MKKLLFLVLICTCVGFGQEIHLGMNKSKIDSILASVGYSSEQKTYFQSIIIPYCSKTHIWINYQHNENDDKRIFRNGKAMADVNIQYDKNDKPLVICYTRFDPNIPVMIEIDKDYINWLVNFEHVNRELEKK
jgi:hypothetical protein